MKRVELLLTIFLIFLVCGCAHVISKDLRASSDLSLKLKQVIENPNPNKGKSVVWGGEIIQTINQKDGTTKVEVFQRSLDWMGKPKQTVASEGRFLVLVEKYLDPYLFRRGRKITMAGEILGEEMKLLGEMDYRYPLLSCKQIYLWEEYYPYPYYYYPWWYYDPWRGFGYHYHHHHR
jgi:outer membrane lipoprotein